MQEFIIEEGEYDFIQRKPKEQYCYISNHDNSLRRIAFPVIGYNGLEIKGNNVLNLFSWSDDAFSNRNSVNVSISVYPLIGGYHCTVRRLL